MSWLISSCNIAVKKPRMLNFEDAAAGIGDCVRAYTALHYQAQVCAGDTVLVLDGASSFGSVAVQLARQWGAKVENCISLIKRKPVFRVCDQVRLKLACSATETS